MGEGGREEGGEVLGECGEGFVVALGRLAEGMAGGCGEEGTNLETMDED